MPSRSRHAALLGAALALAAPAAAPAATGTGGTVAPPEPELAQAVAGPVSVSTRAGAIVRRRTTFRGTVPARDAGRTVTLERLDPLSGQWSVIASATAAGDGSWRARWRPDRPGRHDIRARVSGARAAVATAAPHVGVTVYRAALATWYGPGFYGRTTACGRRMTRGLQGVAHKTLACGTPVTVFHAGRTVTVPVVDRGPFAEGVAYDLTSATAQALGFTGKGVVGAQPVQP